MRALLDLSEGKVSVNDVLLRATMPEGEELLKVTLRQLLLSIPEVGGGTVRRIIERLERFSGKPLPPTRLDVRWLLDGRSRGTRLVALAEAVYAVAPRIRFDAKGGHTAPGTSPAPRVSPPWQGFPYTPPPARLTVSLSDRIDRPDVMEGGGR